MVAASVAGLAVLSPAHAVPLGSAAVLIAVGAALASRGMARPWTDLGAWAALAAVLAWVGGPRSDAPPTLLFATAVVVALAVTLHIPSAGVPPMRGVRPFLVLAATWAASAATLFWPVWRLRDSRLDVLDPATAPGTAARAAVLLVVLAGASAAFALARSGLARRKQETISHEPNSL